MGGYYFTEVCHFLSSFAGFWFLSLGFRCVYQSGSVLLHKTSAFLQEAYQLRGLLHKGDELSDIMEWHEKYRA